MSNGHGHPVNTEDAPAPAQHPSALQRIIAAGERVKAARGDSAARDELQAAVDAARNVGIGWTKIGDALGIASGNAYKRYRRRPAAPPSPLT